MKKTKYTALVLLVCATAVLLCSCNTLKKAAELQSYDFGDDSIPSINSVVGEREVTAVNKGTANGTQYQEYQYLSGTVFDDLVTYLDKLRAGGYIVTKEYDIANSPGSAQVATQSAGEGMILVVDIAYEDGAYSVRASKLKGTVAMNE